jgi:hypothetical protein
MSRNSTLVVHCGGVRRTREELRSLHTPVGTATWRPVPHADLVSALLDGLASQGVGVTREDYCTLGRDDARLLGTLDLRIRGLDAPEFAMGLGLRAGNDKSVAVQFVTACRVFVCDNWAFSGSGGAVFLKRKHTARLDVRGLVPGAVGLFLERAGAFRADIDRMRDHPMTDGHAKAVIHDLFADGVLPIRLFPVVTSLYFVDDAQRAKFPDRSLWSLNNAATEAVKRLRPAPRQACGLRLGRTFGRLLHQRDPEPVAVIDGIEVFD